MPDAVVIPDYQPCEVLILYGWGGEAQQRAIAQHPGRYVAFDLGYWARNGFNARQWRVSFDGFHSPQYIMQGERPSKVRRVVHGIRTRADHNVAGPILLIGNAPKSLAAGAQGWSAQKLREIRQAFPDKQVLYRGKPGRVLEGIPCDGLAMGDLKKELLKASLVVCRHSNVSVDACQLGVPVICDDGAAAAIYPRQLSDWRNQPSQEVREDFLDRLAYWQWSIEDINNGDCWPWIRDKLDDI